MSLRSLRPLLLVVTCPSWLSAQEADGRSQFVQTHCVECHGGDAVKGKLDLTQPAADAIADAWRWARMRERVRSGEMPPPDAERAPAAATQAFVQAIDAHLRTAVPKLPVDPGRVTVRRLSRAQWENCVRDLFGVRVSTAGFPADDLGYGFDSIGDALTFSTLHLEHYLAASAVVAAAVFDGEDPQQPAKRRFPAESMRVVVNPSAAHTGDHLSLVSRATVEQVVRLPRDGVYQLRVMAGADQAGDEPARMTLAVDGRELTTFDVEQRAMQEYVVTTPLAGGERRLELAFVNDFYDPQNPDPKRRDRNLHVDWLEIVGPTDARAIDPAQQWLHDAFGGKGDVLARLQTLAKAVLPRVWRRPADAGEVAKVVQAARQELAASGSPVQAARFVVQAALVSPHFLFRLESGRASASDGVQALSAVAVATRLSFLLWASTPDEDLAKLARDGRFADAAVLVAQVDRMLADPRADALATDFAAQWLELRALGDRTPDPARFPGFDDGLRQSLRRETELLFRAVLRDGLDVRTLLDADFTFVDARLADFYGLPRPAGDGFERATLPAAMRERGGVLGHGSVLAVTSNPTRTSPVKRGKWILENLLGQAPPPPPPGNDSLPDEGKVDSTRSFREQLAQHRSKAACAGCHVRMDTLGFALERYDAIGRHRLQDAGGAIDSSGELPDGSRIDGLGELKRVLVADPAFVRTFAHKLFVYAVGRELRPADALRLDLRVDDLLRTGKVTVRDLLVAVVRDPAFALRAEDAR